MRVKHREAAAPDMTDSRQSLPTPEERELFRAATQGTRPLTAQPVPEARRPAPRARFARADAAQVLSESLTLSPHDLLIETGDELLFRRAAVAEHLLKRLRRGEFSVRDEIDLHGLTSTEARAALREFLAEAKRHGHRCVRIIHGKGLRSGPRGPVLKHAVNTWLRKIDAVLAFASARQMDGGTGAVYVLLDR
jgi:DNA-nicking Smr family endonuclease